MTEIGIALKGGPGLLDGWSNIYDGDVLGGWPPPERIVAFEVEFLPGQVAVARVDNVPESYQDKVTTYKKVRQSKLADDDELLNTGVLVRGAEYEVEEP